MYYFVWLLSCLTSCSNDEIEPSNPNSEEELKNGISSNPFVGNWYEARAHLATSLYDALDAHYFYNFDKNGHYTYMHVSDGKLINNESGDYRYTKDSLFLIKSSTGKENKYKVYKIEPTLLSFGSFNKLKPTTLTSLNEGVYPSTKESAVTVDTYYDEAGKWYVKITPHWGIDHYFYNINGEAEKGIKRSGLTDRKVSNLIAGAENTVSVVAFNAKGEKYKEKKVTITTGNASKNSFIYNYKSYNINRVEMFQRHDNTGTGTGSNSKHLRFYNTDNTFLEFDYHVAEWEGIDKKWNAGTYQINTSTSSYYHYGAFLVINGKSQHTDSAGKGTLKISEPKQSHYIFEINLENITGHFEGDVK